MNRHGFTLMEVLIVIGLIGVIGALAIPRIGTALVRQSVRSSREAVVAMHARARTAAVQRGRATMLVVNGNEMLVISRHPVTGALDTVGSVEDLHSRYGVIVTTTRDSVPFDSRGVGIATGDTKIVVKKGAYQDDVEINAWGRIIR
jgi:prepilin-type N-terminal cleavage/methylation domain-containing protein